MNYLQYLNLIGQLCELIGAYLLFKYGIPPHINKTSNTILYHRGEIDTQKEIIDNNKYSKLTKFGFGLILIGFLFSFSYSICNVISNNNKHKNCQCYCISIQHNK